MHIKNWLEHNAYLIAITFTILITISSLITIPNLGLGNIVSVENSDKYAHFIAHFLLTLSWFYATQYHLKTIKQKVLLVVTIVAYGIIIEALQGGLTTYRTADFNDIIANSLGVILATITFSRLNNWLNSMLK